MIKKTHFVQLSLLMVLLFILFQITSISITFDDLKSSFEEGREGQHNVYGVEADGSVEAQKIYLLGDGQEEDSTMVNALSFMQKSFEVAVDLSEVEDEAKQGDVVILPHLQSQEEYDVERVKGLLSRGVHFILAALPEEISNEMKQVLGIEKIGERSCRKGVAFFEDFLVGDKKDFPKIYVSARDVKVSATAKTFVAAMPDEGIKETNEEVTDYIWRNIYENGHIYTVNGPFLNADYATGILQALFAQIETHYIYPVVNAKGIFVSNGPYLSEENTELLQEEYARGSQRIFMDIILPDLMALSMRTGNVTSFFATDVIRGGNPDYSEEMFEQLNFIDGEAEKIGGVLQIHENEESDRLRTAFEEFIPRFEDRVRYFDVWEERYADSFDNRAVVVPWDAQKGYTHPENEPVYISVGMDGFEVTDRDLLKLHSLINGLGVITHNIDLESVIYPGAEKDHWTVGFKKFSSAVTTYWGQYEGLEALNAMDLAKRVENFEVLESEIIKRTDGMDVKMEHLNEDAYFILRTDEKNIRVD
ncbi:MAG TPA: hypothetical protein DHN33_08270, partial [Eubacteriaceae bacterium]|nr:hypothetical protein [Eubacteriaceae bacterium]